MVIRNTGFSWLKKVVQRQLSVAIEISDYNTKEDSKFEPSMAVRETSVQNVNRKYKCLRIFLEGQLSILFVKSSLNTPLNNWTFYVHSKQIVHKESLVQASLLHLDTHPHRHARAPSPLWELEKNGSKEYVWEFQKNFLPHRIYYILIYI